MNHHNQMLTFSTRNTVVNTSLRFDQISISFIMNYNSNLKVVKQKSKEKLSQRNQYFVFCVKPTEYLSLCTSYTTRYKIQNLYLQ